MRALRVYKTKVALRNTFIVNLFSLGSEKESKNDEKTIFWDILQSLELSLNP